MLHIGSQLLSEPFVCGSPWRLLLMNEFPSAWTSYRLPQTFSRSPSDENSHKKKSCYFELKTEESRTPLPRGKRHGEENRPLSQGKYLGWECVQTGALSVRGGARDQLLTWFSGGDVWWIRRRRRRRLDGAKWSTGFRIFSLSNGVSGKLLTSDHRLD